MIKNSPLMSESPPLGGGREGVFLFSLQRYGHLRGCTIPLVWYCHTINMVERSEQPVQVYIYVSSFLRDVAPVGISVIAFVQKVLHSGTDD